MNGRTVTCYLPWKILEEMRAEAKRLERSPSWMMQMVWKIAREKLMNFDKERK